MESSALQGTESVCVKAEPCDDVCTTDEPTFEGVSVKAEPENAVFVKDEPRCESVPIKAEPRCESVSIKAELLVDPVCVKDEPRCESMSIKDEPRCDSVSIKAEPIVDPVFVKDEPRCEIVPIIVEPLLDAVCVKEELRCDDVSIKAEPSCSDVCVKDEPLSASTAAAASGLYANHDVKDELVLVPELVERLARTGRTGQKPGSGSYRYKCAECEYSTAKKTTLRRHAKKNHAKLVDYEFDSNDDFTPDSDQAPDLQYTPQEESDNITDFSEYTCVHEEKTLTRKRKSNPNVNRTVNKAKRAKCLPYKNNTKDCPAKAPKYIDCSRCKFKCTDNIPEEIRNRICRLYWGLDYGRQKDFILKYVHLEYPKRRKVNVTKKGARNVSKKYYLENSNGKQRVCANFFQKTLNISNGPINTAIKHKGSTGSFIGQDKRGKKYPGNKISEQARNMVKRHIESFAAMESHYVHNTSKKLYLESNLSVSKMHTLYKDNFCTKHGIQPVSEKTYRRIFCSEYNY
ncbi:uncharacterized protein LOC134802081 [Cydia splendana]|uniref:uncharacterized protein LOC134802081 n=1 Tax=Cydia splendana TaxID=1100963 RepID=UPI00300C6304